MIQEKTVFINYSNRFAAYYIEHAKVVVKDGQVLSLKESGPETVPVSLYSCIILGPGTSITAEAAKVVYKRDCVVIYSGGAGIPVYGYSSNYRNPIHKLNQYRCMLNHKKRLKIAKYLMLLRNRVCADHQLPELNLSELQKQRDMQGLMLVEARWVKSIIRFLSDKHNRKIDRDRLKLLNHFCYSVCIPPITALGLDPNIGVIHGQNRGGGLVFDIADIFKPVASLQLSFSLPENLEPNLIKREFLNKIDEMCVQKMCIKTLEEMYSDDLGLCG